MYIQKYIYTHNKTVEKRTCDLQKRKTQLPTDV